MQSLLLKLSEESRMERCLAAGHTYVCARDQAALNKTCSCNIAHMNKPCFHCGKKIKDVAYAPYCSYHCQSISILKKIRNKLK